MHLVKDALERSSSLALTRMVSKKPIYVRIAWLLLFLTLLALFLKGFIEFAIKLSLNAPTSTLEVNSEDFVFPDVYMCFENPISGSYSANVDVEKADLINGALNGTSKFIQDYIDSTGSTGTAALKIEMDNSFMYPHSLPYSLLIDALAQRPEQSVITSEIMYVNQYGSIAYADIEPEVFYHPALLRCLKWSLNATMQDKIIQAGKSSGIIARILIDQNFSNVFTPVNQIQQKVFEQGAPVPISDWSLEVTPGPDQSSGARVFLAPPGFYPSEFATSFSLCPGKHHSVEISMTRNRYKTGQFSCLEDPPAVQFVNPYKQTPEKFNYSHAYCFYYEYHRVYQVCTNMSGDIKPLPWPLRGLKYATNLTGLPNYFNLISPNATYTGNCNALINQIQTRAVSECESQHLCTELEYSASISNTDWPSQSSLEPLVKSLITQSWTRAKARNLSVPALDFLLNGTKANVISYSGANLLKVHFKPSKVQCNRVTFSRDYGASNFIADVGGIMGIYISMSLLTLCEVFELIYDLLAAQSANRKKLVSSIRTTDVNCTDNPVEIETKVGQEERVN